MLTNAVHTLTSTAAREDSVWTLRPLRLASILLQRISSFRALLSLCTHGREDGATS